MLLGGTNILLIHVNGKNNLVGILFSNRKFDVADEVKNMLLTTDYEQPGTLTTFTKKCDWSNMVGSVLLTRQCPFLSEYL